MTVKLYEALAALPAIEKLVGQQVEYPVRIAYRIYKLREELSGIETFLFRRIEALFGGNVDFTCLTEKQREAYQAILNSDIDLDDCDVDMDDILVGDATLTFDDIGVLDVLLKKK